MMAEYDDEDEDILHVDDITKLYGQNFVIWQLIYLYHINYILTFCNIL